MKTPGIEKKKCAHTGCPRNAMFERTYCYGHHYSRLEHDISLSQKQRGRTKNVYYSPTLKR